MAQAITIVRAKNRFLQPSIGGWKDVVINYHLFDDPMKHVCELRLVHGALHARHKQPCLSTASILDDADVGMADDDGVTSATSGHRSLSGCQIFQKVRHAYELLGRLGLPVNPLDREVASRGLLADGLQDADSLCRVGCFTPCVLRKVGVSRARWAGASAADLQAAGFGAAALLEVCTRAAHYDNAMGKVT